MNNKVRVNIILKGFVQGVFFRANAAKKAQELGITGWVKNLNGDKVEIVAEGEQEKLEELIKWTKGGPSLAKVKDIDMKWEDYRGEFEDFEIRY